MTIQAVASSKQAARQDLVGMICICDLTMTPIPKRKAKQPSYGYKKYCYLKIRTHDICSHKIALVRKKYPILQKE